jgi:Protein of unknown function (DUF1236)
MNRLLLSSAAATALLVGLTAATAQRAPDADRERPPAAATQSSQPRAGDSQQGKERAQPRAGARGGEARDAQDRRSREPQAGSQDQPAGSAAQQRQDQRGATSRQAPADDRSGRADRERRQPSGAANEQRRGQERSTTGQAPREGAADRDRQPSGTAGEPRRSQDRPVTGQAPAEGRTGTTTGRPDDSRTGTDRSDRSTAREGRERGTLRLSDERRTRVSTAFSQTVERMNVRPLSRSEVSVSVGGVLPRSVRALDVPADIVRINPEFRGHKFVVVEDEIVIVEPRSYRVVAMLPRSGRQAAARSTTGIGSVEARLRIAPEKRRFIRDIVFLERERICRYEEIDPVPGVTVPRTVRVCEFPQELIEEVPEIRSYRFVVRDRHILLVDPAEYRVVDVID